MKLSRGKITRIKNAKNQSRINMKKITKLGGSKSRYVKSNRKGTNVKGTNVKGTNVKGGARKRRYTNVKKRRAFNLRTKTIKMRQKGGFGGPAARRRRGDRRRGKLERLAGDVVEAEADGANGVEAMSRGDER